MVGWHHQLNGHGFGWTLGAGDGQGVLACYGSWGCKELDTTEATQHAHKGLKKIQGDSFTLLTDPSLMPTFYSITLAT